MSTPVFNFLRFGKTKHFVERQQLRSVDDELLNYVLGMSIPRQGYTWLIVTRSTLKRLARLCVGRVNTQLPLIVVVDNYRLVTCYHSKVFAGQLPENHRFEYL